LGDALGDEFEGVTEKQYESTLNQVEDHDDKIVAGQQGGEGYDPNNDVDDMNDQLEIEEDFDCKNVLNVLPGVFKYGLGMIEGFYMKNYENGGLEIGMDSLNDETDEKLDNIEEESNEQKDKSAMSEDDKEEEKQSSNRM